MEIPEGVRHWHGAAPDSCFSQIVIYDSHYEEGETGDPVTDEEYLHLETEEYAGRNVSKDNPYMFQKAAAPFTSDMFSGAVYVSQIIGGDNVAGAPGLHYVVFEPGVINNWHIHEGGQILMVTDGVGYHQTDGGEVEILRPGDVAFCPPGVKHWHGASAGSAFAHIAVNTNPNLTSLPYVDNNRIGGLGICGSGSYMSVAGVKEPRIKAVTAIVPAISDISTSAMAGFFKPEDEVKAAKEAYEKGEGGIPYLNFMPRAFDEGAAYYYTARGTHPRWSNQVVAWSQMELVKYNVTNIMKDMKKPYCVITAEKAWSRSTSEEVFNAVPHDNKELHVIPEASHFDMYDLAPFVSEAFDFILPFFGRNL